MDTESSQNQLVVHQESEMETESDQNQLALTRWTPGPSGGSSTGDIFSGDNDVENKSDVNDIHFSPRAYSESVRPRDLPLDYKGLLTNGLLADFLAQSGFGTHDCWPWEGSTQYLNSLNAYPMIASCAQIIGTLRGDYSLIRIATDAYHHALRFVQFCCSSDLHLAKSALALVVATNYLSCYEVCCKP